MVYKIYINIIVEHDIMTRGLSEGSDIRDMALAPRIKVIKEKAGILSILSIRE